MIFDTHIHLNAEEYEENLPSLLNEAKVKGVTTFLCVGWDIASSKKTVEIANSFDNVYAAIGIIPTSIDNFSQENILFLEKLAKENNKVIAIGEIGLDYYWEKDIEVRNKQKELFIKQIELANKLNLPVSLHIRDAYGDTLEILKEHKVEKAGIAHCYSGSLETAREFIKLGFKIAFGGVLTFKNSKVSKEVFLGISLDDVVFETDAPYLTPVPYRGKMNRPEYIYETVKYAAGLRNISQEELEDISYKNALKSLHVKTYD